MKARILAVLCTAIALIVSAPLFAEDSGLGCPGPFGPVFGYPDAGLYTVDMISDEGDKVGVVDVFNTTEFLKFTVRPDSRTALTEVQLWTGDDLSTIPLNENNGRPSFSDFPSVEPLKLKKGVSHEIVVNLKDDPLNFSWKGRTKHWGYMLHGEFGGNGSFTAHTVTTSADGARSVYAVDVDADRNSVV